MTTPAWLTVRVAIAIAVSTALLGFVVYVAVLREKAANFDNVVAALETTEASAEISRGTAETVGQRAAKLSIEQAKDHEVISHERAKRSTPVAAGPVPDGVRRRADEAYLAAVCSSLRVSGAVGRGPPSCPAEDD